MRAQRGQNHKFGRSTGVAATSRRLDEACTGGRAESAHEQIEVLIVNALPVLDGLGSLHMRPNQWRPAAADLHYRAQSISLVGCASHFVKRERRVDTEVKLPNRRQ
jgi:hypothetical protein